MPYYLHYSKRCPQCTFKSYYRIVASHFAYILGAKRALICLKSLQSTSVIPKFAQLWSGWQKIYSNINNQSSHVLPLINLTMKLTFVVINISFNCSLSFSFWMLWCGAACVSRSNVFQILRLSPPCTCMFGFSVALCPFPLSKGLPLFRWFLSSRHEFALRIFPLKWCHHCSIYFLLPNSSAACQIAHLKAADFSCLLAAEFWWNSRSSNIHGSRTTKFLDKDKAVQSFSVLLTVTQFGSEFKSKEPPICNSRNNSVSLYSTRGFPATLGSILPDRGREDSSLKTSSWFPVKVKYLGTLIATDRSLRNGFIPGWEVCFLPPQYPTVGVFPCIRGLQQSFSTRTNISLGNHDVCSSLWKNDVGRVHDGFL